MPKKNTSWSRDKTKLIKISGTGSKRITRDIPWEHSLFWCETTKQWAKIEEDEYFLFLGHDSWWEYVDLHVNDTTRWIKSALKFLRLKTNEIVHMPTHKIQGIFLTSLPEHAKRFFTKYLNKILYKEKVPNRVFSCPDGKPGWDIFRNAYVYAWTEDEKNKAKMKSS